MNYHRIEKGTVLGWDCYYVVVNTVINDGDLHLNCICDNANNIYSFTLKQIIETKDPHKWLVIAPYWAVHHAGWDLVLSDEDKEIFDKIGREIPLDVIAEVLTGQHDDRFDHWYKT